MSRRANPVTSATCSLEPGRSAPLLGSAPTGLPDSVPREIIERLEAYVSLVQRWTKTISLVSQRDHDAIWTRHVLDSLRLAPLVPQGTSHAIDLGSGAGFPGLVLALAMNLPFALIEADRRKAAFLVEAQRVTGAPVQVHCARIEDIRIPSAPLVTARALAPLTTLLGHASRLLLPNGTALFHKGARADEEIAVAQQHWRMRVRRFDDPRQHASTILAITGLTHA